MPADDLFFRKIAHSDRLLALSSRIGMFVSPGQLLISGLSGKNWECPANGDQAALASRSGVPVGMGLKSLPQSRAERSIVLAANLKQEIGTSSGPAHLLRLVHSPIDEKVCGSFCDRSSDTQAGTVSLGIVDEPATLASEITVDVE